MPPSVSCSSVSERRPFSLAARRRCDAGRAAADDDDVVDAHARSPARRAWRSPRWPGGPARWRWRSGPCRRVRRRCRGRARWIRSPARRAGMSTPRRAVPKTSSMAPTGQAVLQAPWPMQEAGSSNCALPPIMPMMRPSGQACVQAPQPTHRAGSMTGWSDEGSVSPASMDRCSRWEARRSLACGRRRMRPKAPSRQTRKRVTDRGQHLDHGWQI